MVQFLLLQPPIGKRMVSVTPALGLPYLAAILEKRGKPWVLPAVEVLLGNAPEDRPIFTYSAKWEDDTEEFKNVIVKLADLDQETVNKIEDYAKVAYINMGGRDYPRLDIRLRGKEIFVLELNNNPEIDFTFQGGLRMAVTSVGMDYLKFLEQVVENAIYRHSARRYETVRV